MDEEAKFSAVERPNDKDGAAAAAAAAAAGGDQSNVDSSGKYVPPSRRGGEQQKPPHHARQASNPSNPPNSQNPQNRTQSRDQRNNNVPVPNNEKKQTPNNDRAQYSNKPTTPPRKEPVESRPRKGKRWLQSITVLTHFVFQDRNGKMVRISRLVGQLVLARLRLMTERSNRRGPIRQTDTRQTILTTKMRQI